MKEGQEDQGRLLRSTRRASDALISFGFLLRLGATMALATLAVLAAFDGSWAVALILALGAAGMAPLTVASFRRLQMLKSRQF